MFTCMTLIWLCLSYCIPNQSPQIKQAGLRNTTRTRQGRMSSYAITNYQGCQVFMSNVHITNELFGWQTLGNASACTLYMYAASACVCGAVDSADVVIFVELWQAPCGAASCSRASADQLAGSCAEEFVAQQGQLQYGQCGQKMRRDACGAEHLVEASPDRRVSRTPGSTSPKCLSECPLHYVLQLRARQVDWCHKYNASEGFTTCLEKDTNEGIYLG